MRITAVLHATVENTVLETISLEYHEVLSAAFGREVRKKTNITLWKYKGQYVLVVDGSIPLKDNGIPAWLPRAVVDHIRKAADSIRLSLSVHHSAWGGVAAAGVNPTGAVSLREVLPGKTVINIVGLSAKPA